MDAARSLLGLYVPGRSFWHRLTPGVKYLAFLTLTVPALASGSPWVALGMMVAALALVAATDAPLRLAWGLPSSLVALLAVLAGYHVLSGREMLAVTIVATLLTALYASRILLISTPGPVLVDALARFARPLRRLGRDPDRFALAVLIMIRSVPFVAAAFGEVRQAARARGLERNPLALVAPVVVQTVAYARATGDALAARGLGEGDD